MVQLSPIHKVSAVFGTLKNWYMLPIDKAGLQDHIVYNFRNGTTLKCRSKSTDINEAVVVMSGLEYPTATCQFENEIECKKLIVLDLGGNIGAFATWVKALNPDRDIQLHIFEPHPENLSLLRENLCMNALSDAHVHDVAVAGKSGIAHLDISTGYDAFSIVSASSNMMQIRTLSVRDFLTNCGFDRIDLLKMDVEGAEFEIFESDLKVIASTVSRLIVEFHASPDSRRVIELIAALKEYYDISIFHSSSGGGVLDCRAR